MRRRRRYLSHSSRDCPAAHGEDHNGAHCSSVAHGGPWWAVYPHCNPQKTSCPEESCGLSRAHSEAGSWQDLQPVRDSGWSNLFPEECTMWKRCMLEQFWKNCSLWEGLMLEQRRLWAANGLLACSW